MTRFLLLLLLQASDLRSAVSESMAVVISPQSSGSGAPPVPANLRSSFDASNPDARRLRLHRAFEVRPAACALQAVDKSQGHAG